MSDMGNYKLEDIVWELSDNDDHIVPFAGDKKNGYALERNNFNRPKNELKCAESKADSGVAPGNLTRKMGEASFTVEKEDKKIMREENPWTLSSNGGFPVSLDGDVKRNNLCPVSMEERMATPCLRSENVKSADSEFCADDPALGNRAFAADNGLKQYELNDASGNDNDLAFLGNDLQDKGSDDLLFYGWPELENFEDVDNMFRNCDPTFSLDMNNSDGLSWFSSSHMIEGSNDGLKSDFGFSGCGPSGLNCVTEQQEHHEIYRQNNNGMVVNEINKKQTPAGFERDSHRLPPDICSSVFDLYANDSGATHHIQTQSQIHSHVSPSKHKKSSEGKRKSCSTENGVSFIHFDKLHEIGEANNLLSSQHGFSPDNHQQEINHQLCLQTEKPMIKPINHPSDHVLPSSTPSIVKSEVRALSTISPRESSHASNQKESIENSHDVSHKNLSSSEVKKKGKLQQRRLSRNAEKSNLRVQRVDPDQFCGKKPSRGGKNESECQSEVDCCDTGFARDLDASTNQESSCMSSVLDEVAIDASSLKQLQHVMGQLDIRTKLCIRDSLYRLARSAAQRHKGDNKDANGALLPGTNKSAGFIDMETDTNPIDRSIAHLLFHRPSDPSTSTALIDAMAVKPPIMVEAPNPLAAEKPVYRKETTLVNEDATEQRN
ncbi:hypothetical protein RND81_11G155600 [Saponaria officinalis]|uniref:Protein LNK1 n=1 Tax=Saponaria officinalis TaxID=3572 RepID=A0AAW1HMW1_SAPOF